MAYRGYLREKWSALKWDMENVLKVETKDGKIDEDTLKRVKYNIVDKCKSIINEMNT